MNTFTKSYLKALTYDINGACIDVHRALGSGLLESLYHKCLKHELSLRNLAFELELVIPVNYRGLDIETELRCDLLVEKAIVVGLCCMNPRLCRAIPFPFTGQATLTDLGAAI